jgi:hypothetical protein
VFVNAELDSKRTGKIWSGTGRWTARVVGTCEHVSLGQDFVVSGTRVSKDAACFGVKSNLVSRFFSHPKLIPFLAEATQGESHDKK